MLWKQSDSKQRIQNVMLSTFYKENTSTITKQYKLLLYITWTSPVAKIIKCATYVLVKTVLISPNYLLYARMMPLK